MSAAALAAAATRRHRPRLGLGSYAAIERADLLTSDEPGRVRDYRRMATDTIARLFGREQELYDRVVGGMQARFVRRRLAAIEVELMVRGISADLRMAWQFGVGDHESDVVDACERFALARSH